MWWILWNILPGLGKLKDFELEVQFKKDAEPKFYKARTVPFAIQNDLLAAYDAGIKTGVWKSTKFNSYGTPVVICRLVISQSLQMKILKILHKGHFGIQGMNQLARSDVYWPGIYARIMEISRTCLPFAEHQNLPTKVPVQP